MNLRRLSARAATVGATAALAAGALVGATATSALADAPPPAVNAYTCTVEGIGSLPVTLTVAGDIPIDDYFSGADVGPNTVNVIASVDATTQATLLGLHASKVASADFALPFGKTSVPMPLSGDVNGTTGEWSGAGSNLAFVTPTPANHLAAIMPKSFHITVTTGVGTISAPCKLNAGQTQQTVDTINLHRQSVAILLNAKHPDKPFVAKKGKVVKLPLVVTGPFGAPTGGKVVVKEGKKVLGQGVVKKGLVTVNLGKKLKVGSHTLTVTYAGVPSFKPAKAPVTVIIK